MEKAPPNFFHRRRRIIQSAKLPARVLIAGFVMAQPADWRAAVSIDYVDHVPCEIRRDGHGHRDSPYVPSSTLRALPFVREGVSPQSLTHCPSSRLASVVEVSW